MLNNSKLKKTALVFSLSMISTILFAETGNSLANRQIEELENKGCSVNINGVIKIQNENEVKILIPYTGCDEDNKIHISAYTYKNNNWNNREISDDTSVEKITDYDGMATVTQKVEYIAPKIIKVN